MGPFCSYSIPVNLWWVHFIKLLRRSKHHIQCWFIKVAPVTEDRVGIQSQPSACKAVNYAMCSKVCQRFTVPYLIIVQQILAQCAWFFGKKSKNLSYHFLKRKQKLFILFTSLPKRKGKNYIYTLLILKYEVKMSTRVHESHLHAYIP